MLSQKISRRAFLTAASGAAAGLAAPGLLSQALASNAKQPTMAATGSVSASELGFIQPDTVSLEMWGRTTATTAVREATGLNQTVAQWLHPNTVIPLLEEVHAEGNNPNNDLWYRVDGGFVYTPTIQPMHPYRMPQPIDEINTMIGEEPGVWGEIIVPYTTMHTGPSNAVARLEDDTPVLGFYGSVHRVRGVEFDGAGFRWYRVADDKPKAEDLYVLSRHMRVMRPEEFAPINPGVEKHIVVTLQKQTIECFEGGNLVNTILTSSGGGGFGTPPGDHAVIFKQPSRHMYSDPEQEAFSDPDFFDLPGVPFNIFFTTLGHAIHGTYWHGDYGRPRSHGCLNVSPHNALWLYRWVEPHAAYNEISAGSSANPGTPIMVV